MSREVGRPLRVAVGVAGLLLLPAPALAHGMVGRLETPLPLAAYLAGAGIVVGLSFVIALRSDVRWEPAPPARTRRVPAALILLLRAVGLIGWLWIVVQTLLGGSSDAEVATLFTWVYGWVGMAILCALVGPVWSWLDPFATLHDLGSWVMRRLRIRGVPPAVYPERLAAWPATIGFGFFVWLELVFTSSPLGAVVIAYTVFTLAGMAQYGKDAWRERGEVFSVWFGLLGRVAHWAPAGESGGPEVRRQRFPDGLLGTRWDRSLMVLAALGVGSILYDGLSQSRAFFDLFGVPALLPATGLLVAFLLLVAGVGLLVARGVGPAALGAGLVPIAIGYLIAHYLTFLLGEGQRIVVALSDPFQLGWDLFGGAFFEGSIAWFPSWLVWTVMMIAVIGGHVAGVWAGHLAASRDTTGSPASRRRAQVPLAILMVVLTVVTLWSLGQEVMAEETAAAPMPPAVAQPAAAPLVTALLRIRDATPLVEG